MTKAFNWSLLLLWFACALSVSPRVWAVEEVQAQLAESLPLIGVDRVHRELTITGSGVGVFVLDDWTVSEHGFAHGQAVEDIIRAVAPDAKLWSCKLSFSRATAQDFASCLLKIDRERLPIRVVNMSFSVGEQVFSKPCDSLDDSLTRTIRYLSQKGVIFVAAAGNDGRKDALRYPACLPEVISVGATYDFKGAVEFDTDQVFCRDIAVVDKVTCYSNVADYLDLVAPGTTISTRSAPNFGGTSAATPLVSGVIALMLEAKRTLRAPAVLETLRATGALAPDSFSSQTYPRVDAYRAVLAVLSTAGNPSTSALTISQFDTSSDGVIDDPEYYEALEEWIAGQISDELFFEVTDYWVQQVAVSASRAEFLRGADATLQLFDLEGRQIAALEEASSGKLRSLTRTLANGVYIYVMMREMEGRLVHSIGKLVVLR
ncbi:MAG: hypothetical protein A2Z21_05170 [Candidatus Fraserbacteria bacterium RBG_16_55_9]|uniref:Peptidase S8/S53 domain-containing protein n=1 Tax=Fraserbacteria sp. (strain RBG_16_55_9) TaxID=1817864 RepID=A0A1F5US73_FRAXR|nr:MAG: hypothetical protein A2Z21_05170 [Candidatus Fraserbacteria bacterium RBG_16_55_9]